jgi:hypothetical protein
MTNTVRLTLWQLETLAASNERYIYLLEGDVRCIALGDHLPSSTDVLLAERVQQTPKTVVAFGMWLAMHVGACGYAAELIDE